MDTMDTGFGRLVMSRIFPKIFAGIFLFIIIFSALVTGRALAVLSGRRAAAVFSYIVYAAFAVLIVKQAGGRPQGQSGPDRNPSAAVPDGTYATEKSASARGFSRAFKIAVSFVICFVIYDFMLLLVWTVAAALFRIKKTATAVGVISGTLLSGIIVALGYLHTKNIRTVSCGIAIEGLGAPLSIALISDIHLGVFVGAKHVKKIVERINALSPDMVLIAGDIIDVDNEILDEEEKLTEIAGTLRSLKTKHGVYAVLGNHDPDIASCGMADFLEESGIRLLHNETVSAGGVILMGRTDDAHNERLTMEEMMGEMTEPLIVLDHNPQGIKEAARYGADLVLCGHTHKGQFFPANIFTKWANGKHYYYGYEDFGGTKAVITSGAGFFQLPVRIGSSNEVVELKLVPAKR